MRAVEGLAEVPGTESRALSGDLAMWCFVLAELLVFALLLIALAYARSRWPLEFSAGVATLHPLAGVSNTLLLLTASYLVARGLECGTRRALVRGFALGLLCGLGYLLIKFGEYAVLIGEGYNLRTNTFYFFYFFTTFFHAMHAMLGMVILAVVAVRTRAGYYPDAARQKMAGDSAGSYWHMVDLVWLVLFPLLYLLP